MTKAIGIGGKIGHGKDTVGKMLSFMDNRKRNGIEPRFEDWMQYSGRMKYKNILKFAAPIKEYTAETFGIRASDLEDQEVKDSLTPLGMTYRKFMQEFGMSLREIHQDFWVYKAISKIDTDEPIVFFTDMRFLNEMDVMDITIRVENPSLLEKRKWVLLVRKVPVLAKLFGVYEHDSETELDKVAHNYHIVNDGSLRLLWEECLKISKEL